MNSEKLTVHIKTEHGHIDIYCWAFFPCGQAKFRKLFKIAREWWENDIDEIKRQLRDHFSERITRLDAACKEDSAKYLKYRQLEVDAHAAVTSGKHPNGVSLTKDELKALKEKYKDMKGLAASWKADFMDDSKELAGLKKNMEMLEQVG